VPRDVLRAEFWYRKAAEQGDAYAQEALAAMRETDSQKIAEFQAEFRELNPKAQREFATVLIVDNEPVITDALALILAHYRYRCSNAYNGWAGLARAREVKPDMVISGVINGDGPNGVEMAIQILAEMPNTKILLFTGQAASLDLLEAVGSKGRDLDLVMKPVDPVALIHWCDSGAYTICPRANGAVNGGWVPEVPIRMASGAIVHAPGAGP
jgi:CheY-like chemotaxis protein